MRFGDVPVGARVGAEFWVQQYVNSTLPGTGANYQYAVGSFTMPFNGDAVANGWGRFQWTAVDCYIQLQYQGATDTIVNGRQQGVPNPYTAAFDVETHGYWQNLPEGHTVNLMVYALANVVAPYFQWMLSLVRCYRT